MNKNTKRNVQDRESKEVNHVLASFKQTFRIMARSWEKMLSEKFEQVLVAAGRYEWENCGKKRGFIFLEEFGDMTQATDFFTKNVMKSKNQKEKFDPTQGRLFGRKYMYVVLNNRVVEFLRDKPEDLVKITSYDPEVQVVIRLEVTHPRNKHFAPSMCESTLFFFGRPNLGKEPENHFQDLLGKESVARMANRAVSEQEKIVKPFTDHIFCMVDKETKEEILKLFQELFVPLKMGKGTAKGGGEMNSETGSQNQTWYQEQDKTKSGTLKQGLPRYLDENVRVDDKKKSERLKMLLGKELDRNDIPCMLCKKEAALRCARCTTRYCSVVCQKANWESHKAVCPVWSITSTMLRQFLEEETEKKDKKENEREKSGKQYTKVVGKSR